MALYDVTALGTALEFDTTNAVGISVAKLPGLDRIAVAWYQSTTLVYVQCFNVNPSTGAVTAIGSPLDVEASTASGLFYTSVVAIDGSNLAVFWSGPGDDGFVQLVSVDGTGNVSANGSAVEYAPVNGRNPSAELWDSTHILCSWIGGSGFVRAAILVFNTALGVISVVGTPFEGDAAEIQSKMSLIRLDSTHAVTFYRGANSDGFARALAIDNTTYAVTAAGAQFEYADAVTIGGNSAVLVSASPMVVANGYADVGGLQTYIRTFSINTSTWAITAFGAALDPSGATVNAVGQPSVVLVDSTHLLQFRAVSGTSGYAYSLSYDSGTGNLTSLNSIEFDLSLLQYSAAVEVARGRYVCAWSGSGADGFIQTFNVELPPAFTPSPTLTLLGVGN